MFPFRSRARSARPAPARRLALEPLEAREVPAIVTWDGGSFFSNNWTTGGNWVGNEAPEPGDDLVFPAGAGRLTSNFNNFPAGTAFRSISFTGGGYRLNGNSIFLNGGGGVTNTAGANTIALPMQLPASFGGLPGSPALPVNIEFEVPAGTSLTVSGVVSGGGVVGGTAQTSTTLTKTGFGTLTLTGQNTFLAAVVVEEGVLRAATTGSAVVPASPLGNTIGGTRVRDGATLELASVTLTDEVIRIEGDGFNGRGALHGTGLSAVSYSGIIPSVPIAMVVLTADARVRVDAGSALTIENLSGPVDSGAFVPAGLEKTGDGVLVLTGGDGLAVIDYTVKQGRMEFIGNYPNGSLLLDPAGRDTAAVSGTGAAPGATVAGVSTVNPGATISGVPVGRLTFNGDTTLESGSLLDLQVRTSATSFDRIKVNGAVNINGAVLNLNSGTTTQFPAVGTTFVIVENDGTDPIQGGFSDVIPPTALQPLGFIVPIPDGTTFVDNLGRPWRIDYQGGDGNDVTVTYQGIAPMFQNRRLTPTGDRFGLVRLTGLIVEPEPRDRFILEVDWGDGTRRTYRFPPGSDGTAIDIGHRYRTPGTYSVSLFWHDQHGLGNRDTLSVTIP